MSAMIPYILVAIVAYLLGSISFSMVISRLMGIDIRTQGSGNAGLTNTFRVLGKKAAFFVLIGDLGKGVIATLVGGLILGQPGKLYAGIFAIIGHIFPLFFGFKGGKGILTAAAVMLAFDWRIFLVEIFIFVLCLVLWRYVSLASMIAAAFLPFATFYFQRDVFSTIVCTGIAIALIYYHRGNIARLKNKTEPKFVWNAKKPNQGNDENIT